MFGPHAVAVHMGLREQGIGGDVGQAVRHFVRAGADGPGERGGRVEGEGLGAGGIGHDHHITQTDRDRGSGMGGLHDAAATADVFAVDPARGDPQVFGNLDDVLDLAAFAHITCGDGKAVDIRQRQTGVVERSVYHLRQDLEGMNAGCLAARVFGEAGEAGPGVRIGHHGIPTRSPPSMVSDWPVMKLFSGLAKKPMA
jgi:hypothetical protein